MKRAIFLVVLLVGAAGSAVAANCSSTASGNWNNGGIWSCGITPTNADAVTINNAHNVALNGANRAAFSLVINTGGTLTTGSNSVTIGGGANTGVLTVNGNVAGNGNVASRIIKNSTGNFSGTGTITNVNDVTLGADTTFPAGTTLTFTGNECRLDLSANVDVINNGSLTFNAAACGTTKVINLGNPASFTNNATVITGSIVGASAAGSVWTNAANSTLQVTAALLATGTLNASANGNTVHYNVNAAQAIKLPSSGQYYDLTLSGGNTKTPAAGTYTVLNDLTVNTGVTLNANTSDPTINVTRNATIAGTYTASNQAASAFTVGGDFSLSGTFTGNASTVTFSGNFTNTGTYNSGAGVVTFDGGAQQTITGATTFTNMTVNGAGLLLAANTTVSTTLTMTNGLIETTAAFAMVTSRNCNATLPNAVVRTNGWVNGNFAKTIPANASTCTFEIGDATSYAPVVMTFVAGTGAGIVVAATTGSEHPQIASSGIDSGNSVNRYWTLTNFSATMPAAGYSASFNFVNPGDIDVPANVGTYTVEQWTGSTWLPNTVAGACTAVDGAHLCKTITGEVAFGDFAIGGALAGFNAIPGPFNAFETTVSTTQILGRVFTKLVSTNFTLSIVAINTTSFIRNTAPSINALTVEVMDTSTGTGVIAPATNCGAGWTALGPSTAVAAGAWTSGRKDVAITAPTSTGLGGGPPRAVQNARIRVTQAGTGLVACSTDNFTIRPTGIVVTSSATQNNFTGTPAIKTGADFTITATAINGASTTVGAGYTGTPTVDNTKVVGTPTAGTIGGTFAAGTGSAASGTQFWYTEVGNFGLNANAIVDSSFTSVDQSSDCTSDFSNALVGGKYGCSFGSTAVAQTTGSSGFGRFIPDHFDVAYNTPVLAPGCSAAFTYIGQSFGWATAPVLTVTARRGTAHSMTDATTVNYAGNYMKITNSTLTPNTQAARFSRFNAGSTPALDTASMPAVAGDPQIRYSGDGLGSEPAAGTVVLNFSPTGLLSFTRTASTVNDPFNADIALAINVIDGDSVAFATNPASFGAATSGNGIGFTLNNKEMRYGRVRLLNASGPTTADIPVTLRAEYYAGASSGFILSSTDSCTPLAQGNFRLLGHTGSLTAGNMPNTNVSVPATLTNGVASGMKILKPTSTATGPGSVRLCFDLDTSSAVGDTTCQAPTSAANRTYLQGPWTGTTGTYDKDPVGQLNVGTFGQPNNFIFFRENY